MKQIITYSAYLLSLLGIFLLGCHHKDPSPLPEKMDFSCVKLFDEIGQSNGIFNCMQSPDWSQIPLSGAENAYLDFPDTVSVAGTVAANITEMFAYPVPVIRNGTFQLRLRSAVADQPVKLKLAIIDEDKNVLSRFSLRTATNHSLALQLPDDIYAPGKYYRVYYRASAEGNASLFEGYGNILICKQQVINGNFEGDCF